jgi:hypothetical protein
MTKRWYGRAVSVCLLALGCGLTAQASTSTYIFQVANEADAIITVGGGQITITLNDLFVNPNTVADNLSAFWFTTSVTPTGTPAIATSVADSIDIAGNGTYTDAGSVAPGWAFSDISAVTKLDDLAAGGAGPSHTLIGAPGSGNIYNGPGGDGSIDGNGPHNPFLNQTATWTINETGVTSATTISGVHFQFGTTDGNNVSPGTVVATPEPASAGLVILGCISLFLMGRKSLLRSR